MTKYYVRLVTHIALLSPGAFLTACSGSDSKPDSPERPNLPMFVDPVADLKPVDALAESWFIVSNLRNDTREFGLLIHYLKTPFGVEAAIAITDVSTGRYLLDEDVDAKLSPTQDGFVVKADGLEWSASASEMHAQGRLKSGESFALQAHRIGPALAYNGTGRFPLIDNSMQTLEFAYPTMDTTGTITSGTDTFQVQGNTWFDRQCFRSPLTSGSWTWIATRLPNGDVLAVWDAVDERERAWANIMRPDGTLIVADVELLRPRMSGFGVARRAA